MRDLIANPKIGRVYYDCAKRRFRRLVEIRFAPSQIGGIGCVFSSPTRSYKEAKEAKKRPFFYFGYGFSPEEVDERFVLITRENLPHFAVQVIQIQTDWYVREEVPAP